MKELDGDEWLSVADAAERFDIRPSLLYRWAQHGRVESITVGTLLLRTGDVADAEHAWRKRRKGHQRRAVVGVLGGAREVE